MTTTKRHVAVYCGSSSIVPAHYLHAARTFGTSLAQRGHGLVYGGATVGLMGAVADGVLHAGGEVLGVLPEVLAEREIMHTTLTRFMRTGTMHERKQTMIDHADAFVALPGGYGTLDELFEVLTWSMLNIHNKPVGLFDVDGYYDDLLRFLDRSVRDGFVSQDMRDRLIVGTEANALLERMGL
jgi:hypothetical protein